MMGELTPFKCRAGKGGHILGMTRRDEDGMVQLLLFRRALYEDATISNGSMEEMDVMGIVDGLAEFKCSVCGRIRTWISGPEVLQKFIIALKQREANER